LARVLLEDVSKSFGDVAAVKHLNLEIRDKEFLVLLGPSGCGKTTALRCIAGLEAPDSGEVRIGDQLVTSLPPRDRNIAMVFQSYALYPHMTVYENLAFPLRVRKTAKKDIDSKVRKSAETLRITDLLERKPKQLSGGEQQRVALGRALVREPNVFLMDEPLSNLDAKLRLHMRAELKRLQKELEITTIYVTHDQAEAMTMADRIAVMDKGVLQQLASPDEIYNKPVNAFVAGFLGSPPMNFIDCTLVRKADRPFLDAGTFVIELAELRGSKIEESELIIGIRPEDVTVETKGEDAIEMEVYVVEPLGSEVVLDLRTGENILKLKTSPNFTPRIGEKIWVKFNKNKTHVFDKTTGKALL
jgi:multiple sugar transport system ATP-binding protein